MIPSASPMLPALKWRVLWPVAVALGLCFALLGTTIQGQQRIVSRIDDFTKTRTSLDRAILHLSDRHIRTVRRAREALSERRLATRVAMLAWMSDHYLTEMDRFISEVATTLERLRPAESTQKTNAGIAQRMEVDRKRLLLETERISGLTQEVAAALDLLLDVASTEDPEELVAALQELDRTDTAMHDALRVLAGVVQRTASWRAGLVSRPAAPANLALWILLALWIPAGAYLVLRPLRRIGSLAAGKAPTGSSGSQEEVAIRRRLSEAAAGREELGSQLDERRRQAERATQSARRAERELALFKLYNENLVNSLRSAIVVSDAAGRITTFNRPARNLLGLDEAVLGSPLAELALYEALASRSAAGRDDVERALAKRHVLRHQGVPFRQEETEILLDVTVAPYLDESGATRGLLWVADDVTESVRIKNQLLAAEHLAAVGRLSAQVAHEIRNPLSAVGLNAEMLEEEFVSGLEADRKEEAVALLRAIGSEVERLTQVTETYLQLARIPRPDCRDADLNQLITDLFTMLGEEMKAHQVKVVLDLATPPPYAWVDRGQLRQALLNIVRNGREAMPAGGTLRVLTAPESKAADNTGFRSNAKYCRIEIIDSGTGISSEAMPRVFEPFYSTKPNGTGLGLSLTEQIVSGHGGTIDVEPAPPSGHGTRVILHLPRNSPASSIPQIP